MNPSLHDAVLAHVPDLHQHCRDPWAVIGSAAARLVGADVTVADLDVLTSSADAERMIECWRSWLDATHVPMDSERFRSRFARFCFPELPVELMGGLELHETDGWQPVRVSKLVHVTCADISVPVPVLSEQIRILERFARPKDLQRASLLRALPERSC